MSMPIARDDENHLMLLESFDPEVAVEPATHA
jgi:hypothetical protein